MMIGLVWNVWLVLIGFFLFLGAQMEDRSVVFQSVLETVRMEQVMLTQFSILSPADTLEDALSKAVHTLQDDFPVVRGMEMVGVISKSRIVDALRRDGNGYVQPAMVRSFEVAKAHRLAGGGLPQTGHGRGLSMIPVVDSGRLVGIVTMQNLMHSMALLAESRRLKRAEEEGISGGHCEVGEYINATICRERFTINETGHRGPRRNQNEAALDCTDVVGVHHDHHVGGMREPPPPCSRTFTTPYQAVLLSNNSVYFGKLAGFGTPTRC